MNRRAAMDTRTQVVRFDEGTWEEAAGKTASFLLAGEICVIPTDTIYGIVALDRFPGSVRKIYEIKGRPEEKPFIRLIGGPEMVSLFTDQPLPRELGKYWPGPLTLIFRGRDGGKIALRYPQDPFLASLFAKTGGAPIVAPSANPSGGGEIHDCAELERVFSGKVSLIVCAGGGHPRHRASTILDISGSEWRVIRQGDLLLDPALFRP